MDEELDDQRIEALEKMNFEYKLISEDADTITVFLKIKAGQEKEPQKNVAGAMVTIPIYFAIIFLAMYRYQM